MNHTFKVIWNASRQAWMVASELTRGKSKSSTATSAGKLNVTLNTALLAAGLSVIALPAWSADIYWNIDTGDWFTTSNWDVSVVPTSDDNAFIDNDGIARVISDSAQAGLLYVGYTGNGNLSISNGGSVNNTGGAIGLGSASTGSVSVEGTGSSWTNSDELLVGFLGRGTLNISNYASVTNTIGYIAYDGSSTGSVTVDDRASWTNNGDLFVGFLGGGILNIINDASVTNTIGYIGTEEGSVGYVYVGDPGYGYNDRSSWTNSGALFVGGFGEGNLVISNGSSVSNTIGYIGFGSSLFTSSVDVQYGASWTNSGALFVGALGQGRLGISYDASVSNTIGYIAYEEGSTGSVIVSQGASWTNSQGLFVGYGGEGSLFISNGAAVTSNGGSLGILSGGTGTVTITGSGTSWTNDYSLNVGGHGNGSLVISAGGSATTRTSSYIGLNSGSTGSVTVEGAGSNWTIGNDLWVGEYGVGSLNISDGGLVTNSIGYISYYSGGLSSPSSGRVTVEGTDSSWINSGDLFVGNNYGSNGNLSIESLASVSNTIGYIAYEGGSTGSVTVRQGGSWTNSNELFIGELGNGSLTINDAGIVNVNSGAGRATIANSPNSMGTLNIGAAIGDTAVDAGTLNAASVVFGAGTGSVVFNHTNTDYTFSPSISGAGTVKLYSGTTIFTNGQAITGNTTIYGGTLKANNTTDSATGTGAVTVASSGTLGGSGIITGAVTVYDGGIIAAGNSPGTLTVGSLILNNASILDFELGSTSGVAGVDSDLIAVSGNLTLDGILNITNLSGFDFATAAGDMGSYQLFSYGGTLTDNTLSFGSGVLAGYNYNIDTDTSGQVLLTADYTGLQFWDGTNTVANNTVNGGSSTWDVNSSNWASQSGDINLAWRDLTAVFSATAGTVEVNGAQTISGLQFASDGYQLSDVDNDGELVLAATGAEMRINAGVTANIDVELSGTGSLTQSGNGTLILTADNTYSGGTSINSGTLQLGNGGTTGSITGNIINNAALSFNRSDDVTYAGSITGAGSIGLVSGSTRFIGDLTGHTGTLTVDGGSLAINSNETLSLGGNYTLAAASTLNVAAADDATYSKLVVAGTATLASNAKININLANPNFGFTTAYTNGMADIISAGTLISDGTFAVTDNSYLFNFGAVKDGNTVDLTLTPAAQSALAITTSPAALGVAAAIDSIILDDPTGEIASSFVSLTTEQEVIDAIESLPPTASGGIAQTTVSVTSAFTSVIDSRQDTQQGISSGDDFMTDRHIWFKPFGGWTEQDTRQGVTGYDVDSYGLAFGIDGDVSSSWNAGFALAYINSDVASTLAAGAQGVDIDSYLAKVYATNMLDATTALNLQAGFGLSNYDSNRRIFTGDVASADYDSWNVQLSTELTRSYKVSDKTVISPYVHADYSYVNVDSYIESGAGAFNLNVNDDSNDSLVIGTGIKGNHAVSDSLLLMANAGIGYDVMTDRNSLTSSFAGGGAQFTTDGIEPDEWVYNAGVGAKYSLDNGTEITASYNIDARQDYTDQSLSANFRMMF